MNTDFAAYLLTLPSAQFKAIKKAVQVLRRAGVSTENAMNVVIVAHQDRRQNFDRTIGVYRKA